MRHLFVLILFICIIAVLVSLGRRLREFAAQLQQEARRHRSKQELESHYAQVLELHTPVTPDEIKRNYRQLIAKYHPDKVQHLGTEFQKLANHRSKELNDAYAYFRKKYRF